MGVELQVDLNSLFFTRFLTLRSSVSLTETKRAREEVWSGNKTDASKLAMHSAVTERTANQLHFVLSIWYPKHAAELVRWLMANHTEEALAQYLKNKDELRAKINDFLKLPSAHRTSPAQNRCAPTRATEPCAVYAVPRCGASKAISAQNATFDNIRWCEARNVGLESSLPHIVDAVIRSQ